MVLRLLLVEPNRRECVVSLFSGQGKMGDSLLNGWMRCWSYKREVLLVYLRFSFEPCCWDGSIQQGREFFQRGLEIWRRHGIAKAWPDHEKKGIRLNLQFNLLPFSDQMVVELPSKSPMPFSLKLYLKT